MNHPEAVYRSTLGVESRGLVAYSDARVELGPAMAGCCLDGPVGHLPANFQVGQGTPPQRFHVATKVTHDVKIRARVAGSDSAIEIAVNPRLQAAFALDSSLNVATDENSNDPGAFNASVRLDVATNNDLALSRDFDGGIKITVNVDNASAGNRDVGSAISVNECRCLVHLPARRHQVSV